MMALMNNLRNRVGQKIESLFKEQSALAKALVTGDEEDINKDTKEIFSISGLSHILSISGSHIVMMAAALSYVLKRFRAERRVSFVISQVFILFYAAFTGFRISILRAALMYEFDLCGRFWGLKRDPLTFLSAAYLAIVIPFPAQIFDLGLQLSFGAVFSILCLAPVFSRLIRIKRKPINAVVSAGLAANIGLLPIIVNTNNLLWAPGIALNVIATLYSVLLIPLMSAFSLLYLLLGGFVAFLSAVGDFLIDVLVWMAEIPKTLPGFNIYFKDFPAALSIAWFLVLFLSSDKAFISTKFKRMLSGSIAAVFVLFEALPGYMGSNIRLEFLDCSGNCAIFYTEKGDAILIGSSANEDLQDYVLNIGIDFAQSFVIIKDKDSMEGMAALSSVGRAGDIYAPKSIVRVLKNKYAISAEPIEFEVVELSPRCSLEFIYRSNDCEEAYPVGILLKADDKNLCLFLVEYIEDIPKDARSCSILCYGEGVSTDIFEKISCNYGIVCIPKRDIALAYENKDSRYTLINTDVSGKVTAYVGKNVRMEVMYESG